MATLTEAQIARIRRQSGDTGDHLDVSDADLQVIYDDPEQGNGDLARTIYYVLDARMAKAATEVVSLSDSGTGMSYSTNRKYENLKKMRDEWAAAAGITIGTGLPSLTVGTLSLGIDTTDADLAAGL